MNKKSAKEIIENYGLGLSNIKIIDIDIDIVEEIKEIISMATYGISSKEICKLLNNNYSIILIENIIESLADKGQILIAQEITRGISEERYFIK